MMELECKLLTGTVCANGVCCRKKKIFPFFFNKSSNHTHEHVTCAIFPPHITDDLCMCMNGVSYGKTTRLWCQTWKRLERRGVVYWMHVCVCVYLEGAITEINCRPLLTRLRKKMWRVCMCALWQQEKRGWVWLPSICICWQDCRVFVPIVPLLPFQRQLCWGFGGLVIRGWQFLGGNKHDSDD